TARLPPPLVLGIPLHRLPAPPPATLLPYTTLFRSAQRQLADHDHEADEEHEQQVYHEEGEAAVGAHLVREAPQVAEADGRADRGHEEAEIAPPVSAFVFHIFPPFLSLPTGFPGPVP